jgi:hypothetical protein
MATRQRVAPFEGQADHELIRSCSDQFGVEPDVWRSALDAAIRLAEQRASWNRTWVSDGCGHRHPVIFAAYCGAKVTCRDCLAVESPRCFVCHVSGAWWYAVPSDDSGPSRLIVPGAWCAEHAGLIRAVTGEDLSRLS